MRFYTNILVVLTLSVLLTVAQSDDNNRIKRRMYAMCPPKFHRIGADCYAISDQRMNWLEAHFQCKDKNSKLAEPNKNADRKLRSFFEKMDRDPDDIWIGATYDWHSKLWQWSISGKNLTYDAFSQLDPESRKNLEYHCAVFDPSLKYRWSARSCVDKHRYICQHKMPKVSEKNRNKVYARWNQTFPDQLANEVLLEVIDTKGKDGRRIHRRVKPVDSDENYPVRVDRRPTRRHRPARLPENLNDISVSFIPNDQNNEINGASQYYPTSSPTPLPIVMKFIPGDLSTSARPADVQSAQAYPDEIITRSEGATKASAANNETVEKPNRRPSGQRKRVRNNFDKIAEQQRRKERERKRAFHLRRKQQREQRQRAKEEEEKRKQKQSELDELKQKQAEEDKQLKEQEHANRVKQGKLAAERENEEKQREAELKVQEEQREEEERARKQRLHEENRLRLEHEAKIKEKETERERALEEEKRVSEENRRRAQEEERQRQEELKRLQEEDEKRLELQRVQLERKREEEELARLEEENRKRIAAQKAREEEIRRREEELARQEAEEKRLQEELKIREEQDRMLQQEQIDREAEEKRQKEEMERRDREYQDQLRRQKEEKLKMKIEVESKQRKEEEERQRKERAQQYVERISRLSPEARATFMQARQRRKKNKSLNNEVTIPERK